MHPEIPQDLQEIIQLVEESKVTDVWCHGCGMYRQMNANFSQYVTNGIQSCRFCRDGGMLN